MFFHFAEQITDLRAHCAFQEFIGIADFSVCNRVFLRSSIFEISLPRLNLPALVAFLKETFGKVQSACGKSDQVSVRPWTNPEVGFV